MPPWLAAVPIEQSELLTTVYVIAGVLVLVMLVPLPGMRASMRTRVGAIALGAGLGALLGWGAVWWLVDVQDVFGAPASTVIRAGATGAGAAVGVGIANLIRTRWWRKAVAVVAIVAAAAAGGLVINRDVAYFPRLGDVFGQTGVKALALDAGAGTAPRSLSAWQPPAGMPTTGTVGTADIPGTVSHWHGRTAWIYLPPAARVKNPPKLPVVIAFGGQPGYPSDVFLAGDLQKPLDAIAAAHRGLAPIVVVPDQLGSYNVNPMCINSKVGQVATYVTVDVRDWILHHLPVSTSRREWTVAGFSQGATCAVQFGTGEPTLFGSFIAVSPELGPFNGTLARTIKQGWNGSRAGWEAAQPIAIMERTKHYPATAAVYAVGEWDKRYGADAGALAVESRKVGMRVSYRDLTGLAHNWNTGAAGLAYGLHELVSWWRLP
ncbi:MAG: esterase family protein [Acidobacteria bacterium]|nr:esterase family protein [Acidobacteriota bacterium]